MEGQFMTILSPQFISEDIANLPEVIEISAQHLVNFRPDSLTKSNYILSRRTALTTSIWLSIFHCYEYQSLTVQYSVLIVQWLCHFRLLPWPLPIEVSLPFSSLVWTVDVLMSFPTTTMAYYARIWISTNCTGYGRQTV